jgi:valyl-tRNA synthetase
LLIVSSWPKNTSVDAEKAREFRRIQTIVSEIRQVKTMLDLRNGTLYFTEATFIKDHADIIAKLAHLESVVYGSKNDGIRLTQTDEPCWIDVDAETTKRFNDSRHKRLDEIDRITKQLEGRLNNQGYMDKAPQKLIDETRSQLESLKNEKTTITQQLERFTN